MPAQQMNWTAEMARALPDDGKRYEVLDGELFVTPAPSCPDDERPEILARWQPRSCVVPLEIDLTAFFASALD